jgi:hypothetical protein
VYGGAKYGYTHPILALLDALDVLFKANLRNLDLLEDWLLKDASYKIALMPKKEFLPRKTAAGAPNTSARDKCKINFNENQPTVLTILGCQTETGLEQHAWMIHLLLLILIKRPVRLYRISRSVLSQSCCNMKRLYPSIKTAYLVKLGEKWSAL